LGGLAGWIEVGPASGSLSVILGKLRWEGKRRYSFPNRRQSSPSLTSLNLIRPESSREGQCQVFENRLRVGAGHERGCEVVENHEDMHGLETGD